MLAAEFDPDPGEVLTLAEQYAVGQSPEEMARFVDSEIAKWGQVVKASGAKLD